MDAKITVIIPCYNEVNTIEKILDKVRKVEIKKQIIVVDDCSSDGTKNILKNKLKDKIDLLIEHKQNYGKGKCIITAKPHVLNDILRQHSGTLLLFNLYEKQPPFRLRGSSQVGDIPLRIKNNLQLTTSFGGKFA